MANSMTHARNWRVLSTLPSTIKWNSVLFIQMIEDDNISLCTRASPSISSSSHSVRCWLKKEFPFLTRDSSFCFCTLVLQEKVIDFCVISGSLEKHNTSLELKKAGAAVFYYHFSASFFLLAGAVRTLASNGCGAVCENKRTRCTLSDRTRFPLKSKLDTVKSQAVARLGQQHVLVISTPKSLNSSTSWLIPTCRYVSKVCFIKTDTLYIDGNL